MHGNQIQLKNDVFLRALKRQPVSHTPIWLMRQAGRYLPEYLQTRKHAGSFMGLCTNPELACEVTLQPLRRYSLDAAILFSDILTIPDAMGLGLYFEEGEGPRFKNTVRSYEEIEKLPVINPHDDLSYVMNAIRLINKELNGAMPLIGFSGSPWTLATYIIEGGSSKDFKRTKTLVYKDPDFLHLLLDKLADCVALYLQAQIQSGVHAIQIFDTWGGVLSHNAYQTFSLAYMAKIIKALSSIDSPQGARVPVILFTKGGGLWLERIVDSGCDAIGLDWTIDIGHARERVNGAVALQGNLDPMALFGSREGIKREVTGIIDSYGTHPGHIFNLGHGILPDIPTENVGYLVDLVHEYSAKQASISN